MWDLTFYLTNMPPLQKLGRHWSAFSSLVVQKLEYLLVKID